jgi:hypothetical protein
MGPLARSSVYLDITTAAAVDMDAGAETAHAKHPNA